MLAYRETSFATFRVRTVLYFLATDNSGVGKCSKMSLFHSVEHKPHQNLRYAIAEINWPYLPACAPQQYMSDKHQPLGSQMALIPP